jgi:predicted nucleic acid-binding protein
VTILLDSDVLIEISRAKNAGILSKWMDLSAAEALILFSPVTMAELWDGARPHEYASLQRLFEALICVPTDLSIGRQAGEYLNRYRRSHAVELGDALIAASAVAAGAVLWTRNRKHYPMPELRFYD